MNVSVERVGEGLRKFLIGDYEAKVERRDPHGHWFFVWPSGPVPDALSGTYTSPSIAAEAYENWFTKLPPRLKPVPAKDTKKAE